MVQCATSPLPLPITSHPFPGGETPSPDGSAAFSLGRGQCMARRSLEHYVHNWEWWLVPLSAASLSASFLCPCETHLWTWLYWLRFHNGLLRNGKRKELTPLLQLKQYGFSSVSQGKPGYRGSACVAKMRGCARRGERAVIPLWDYPLLCRHGLLGPGQNVILHSHYPFDHVFC